MLHISPLLGPSPTLPSAAAAKLDMPATPEKVWHALKAG
jgi:hypothetical protein